MLHASDFSLFYQKLIKKLYSKLRRINYIKINKSLKIWTIYPEIIGITTDGKPIGHNIHNSRQ